MAFVTTQTSEVNSCFWYVVPLCPN